MKREKDEGWLRERASAAALHLGCELVDLTVRRSGPRWVLLVTVDRPGGVSIADCAAVSRYLGRILDDADAIPHAYNLEVSSPGLTRPLTCPADYDRFRGRVALVQTRQAVGGRTRLRGTLEGTAEGGSSVRLREADGSTLDVPWPVIAWGRLDFEPNREGSTAFRARPPGRRPRGRA